MVQQANIIVRPLLKRLAEKIFSGVRGATQLFHRGSLHGFNDDRFFLNTTQEIHTEGRKKKKTEKNAHTCILIHTSKNNNKKFQNPFHSRKKYVGGARGWVCATKLTC